MKRIICIICTVFISVSLLAGCGNKEDSKKENINNDNLLELLGENKNELII